MKKVLFICTGNFYRSRFCEALFNYLADKKSMGWTAFSRGLNIGLADSDSVEHGGEISKHTKSRLEEMGVSLSYTGSIRAPLIENDLVESDLAYAAMEEEHRPMMRDQFPEWENKINYWQIGDLWHNWPPKQALGYAHILVNRLIKNLK